uniref:Uncharacterized protein n=1 Tax=Romanomermis culicivorax TaxID=13658 RepID=A0A915IR48_ROMCU
MLEKCLNAFANQMMKTSRSSSVVVVKECVYNNSRIMNAAEQLCCTKNYWFKFSFQKFAPSKLDASISSIVSSIFTAFGKSPIFKIRNFLKEDETDTATIRTISIDKTAGKKTVIAIRMSMNSSEVPNNQRHVWKG